MGDLKKFRVDAKVTIRIPVSHIFEAYDDEEAMDIAEESGVFEEIWSENLNSSSWPEVEIEQAIGVK